MSATVDFTRLNTLQAKGANLTAQERAEYIALVGQAQSALHQASQHASSVGIKMASAEQTTAFSNAVNILVFNLEGILRYHGNVVLGNQVAALNTIALKLGIPTHDSAMGWYNALPSLSTSMVSAAVQQGIDKGRSRNTWTKEIEAMADRKGQPSTGPVDLAAIAGK